MYLKTHKRKKNGKYHEYYSIAEKRKIPRGRYVEKIVLYLGEISGSQKKSWEKSIQVLNEDNKPVYKTLFAIDNETQARYDVDTIPVKLSKMKLSKPRAFGDCWLGCEIWDQLGLDKFWSERIDSGKSPVEFSKVLKLLTVNRLIKPGSEFYIHHHWFDQTAMASLLDCDYEVASKDRLYRCLDRIVPYKDELCKYLTDQWQMMFNIEYDILLYDITSTYFEGLCKANPKARFGHSKDRRSDCRQVLVALVVTPDGFPINYEVLAGNTAEKTTLTDLMAKIEKMYGKARRLWLMDRGIPTEQSLAFMRQSGIDYLVGTPRRLLDEFQSKLIDQDWQRFTKRLGVLEHQAGSCRHCVDLKLPDVGKRVTNFDFSLNHEKYRAMIYEERVDAHIFVAFLSYCLQTTLRHKLRQSASGLTAQAVLETLCRIQMLDVTFQTQDNRILLMERYTEPQPEHQLILHHLKMELPTQKPPKIYNNQIKR